MKTILLTGAAGFIGSHTAERLLLEGNNVIGIDELNDYYPKKFKINDNLSSKANWKYYVQF